MKIYFVRHGESEANILRQISNRGWVHGLTEKGRGQAAALASKLQDCRISKIYTSPLKRGVETAQILSTALNVPYEPTGALREFDCGVVEQGADEDSWKLWHWVWDEWHQHGRLDSKIEGGESYHDLCSRLYPFVQSLISQKPPKNYLLIGHGGLFCSVLPGIMVNEVAIRSQVKDLGLANTAYVTAEPDEDGGLICLEWAGVPIRPA